jgi:hypothetical protein
MSSDTARSGMAPSDTTSGATRGDTGLKGDSARGSSRMHSDSSRSNQSKSGVTDNSGVDSAR